MRPFLCVVLLAQFTGTPATPLQRNSVSFVSHIVEDGCLPGWCGPSCFTECHSSSCAVGAVCSKDCNQLHSCNTCADGFWGSACQYRCQVPNNCATLPTCRRSDGQSVVCSVCKSGFAGPDCSIAITCPRLFHPENGGVSTSECLLADVNFGTTCNYFCNEGYRLTGQIYTTCENPGSGSSCAIGVKTCEDGSKLQRQVPDCSFPPCPIGTSLRAEQASNSYYFEPGCPLEKNGYRPILTEFLSGEHECRDKCDASDQCTGYSFGMDVDPNTCHLFSDEIPLSALDNFLGRPGRMSFGYKPVYGFGFALFTDSCVVGRTLKIFQGIPEHICAHRCKSSSACIAFKWGYDESTPYFQSCILFDHILPDPLCYQKGTRYSVYSLVSLDMVALRASVESRLSYEGDWGGSTPTCVARTCSATRLEGSITMCAGSTGDICFPEPEPKHICVGALKCESTGLFKPLSQSVSTECIELEECILGNNLTCGENASCAVHESGVPACQCNEGYFGTGKTCSEWGLCPKGFKETKAPTLYRDRVCEDVNECLVNNGNCDHRCVNMQGGYACSCARGYELASNQHSCNPSSCLTHSVPNGKNCTGRTGEACDLVCNSGYRSVGILVCQPSGKFVGDAECIPGPCSPHEIPNAAINCTGNTGEVCHPECKPGYSPNGSLTCAASGVFEGIAACKAMKCAPFQPQCYFGDSITNVSCGASACRGSTNDECSAEKYDFQCANGWRATGSVACHPSIEPSVPEFRATPTGIEARCVDIDECLTNSGGCDHFCINTPGSYHCACRPGYNLSQDGLSCAPLPCEDSQAHAFSQTTCTGKVGDLCFPNGVPGYTCTGTEVCQPNGEFTLNTQCWARPCEQSVFIGQANVCNGTTGTTCTPLAKPGYTCSGYVKCMADGFFAPFENARCERISCPPYVPAYSTTTCNGAFGDTCVFEPADDYVCAANIYTCGSDGQWHGTPDCRKAGCQNCAEKAECGPYHFASTCICQDGFWGSGKVCTPWTTCGEHENEIVSASPFHDRLCKKPTCEDKNGGCGPHTICSISGQTILCRPKVGYVLDSDRITAIPRECKPFQIAGSEVCTGRFNDTCHVKALEGYVCSGVKRCGRDGYWFGSAQCDRVTCPSETMEGSLRVCSGKYGDRCTLKCQMYSQAVPEDATVVCRANGTWGGAVCQPQSRLSCDKAFGHYKDVCGRELSLSEKESEPGCSTPGAVLAVDKRAFPLVVDDRCLLSCGDYDNVVSSCDSQEYGMFYDEAEHFCRSKGARLCRLDEVISGAVFSGFDDKCDLQSIWTSSACGPSHRWVEAGNPVAASAHSRECRPESHLALVRCCADSTPYPDWNECDCEGCNGLGDCDPVRGRCADTLGSYQCYCEHEHFVLGPDGRSCVLECPVGTQPSENQTTCEPAEPGTGDVKEISSLLGGVRTAVQYGAQSWPVADDCLHVPFAVPFADPSIVVVHFSLASTDENATAAIQSIEADGFVICQRKPSSGSFSSFVQSANSVDLTWMAFELNKGVTSGTEKFRLSRGRACKHVVVDTTRAEFENIFVNPKSQLPATAWIENRSPRGFDVCVWGITRDQVIDVNWMAFSTANLQSLHAIGVSGGFYDTENQSRKFCHTIPFDGAVRLPATLILSLEFQSSPLFAQETVIRSLTSTNFRLCFHGPITPRVHWLLISSSSIFPIPKIDTNNATNRTFARPAFDHTKQGPSTIPIVPTVPSVLTPGVVLPPGVVVVDSPQGVVLPPGLIIVEPLPGVILPPPGVHPPTDGVPPLLPTDALLPPVVFPPGILPVVVVETPPGVVLPPNFVVVEIPSHQPPVVSPPSEIGSPSAVHPPAEVVIPKPHDQPPVPEAHPVEQHPDHHSEAEPHPNQEVDCTEMSGELVAEKMKALRDLIAKLEKQKAELEALLRSGECSETAHKDVVELNQSLIQHTAKFEKLKQMSRTIDI
eukprot:c4632_g1_i1.p1 GENE.c4632_g1_i1~~c4632_g1_i1.p1  ORF type:complete len:1944 (-),score=161.80 c4632_g1_i1:1725-7556(-)